jgi:2OG-Fe(II) oxygenase superfamily
MRVRRINRSSLLMIRGIVQWAVSVSLTSAFSSQDRSGASVGCLIQEAATFQQAAEVAGKFWLPSDPNLPQHFSQSIHHDKRQRWASQLLDKLATFPLPSSRDGVADAPSSPGIVLDDYRLTRLILAAAVPHDRYGLESRDSDNKRDRWMLDSLLGVYTLVGRIAIRQQGRVDLSSDEARDAIQRLIGYCCRRQAWYSLDKAWEIHTASKGLRARIPRLAESLKGASADDTKHEIALSKRVSELPFEIVPMGIDLEVLARNADQEIICDQLLKEIPFSKDTIVTMSGESVIERRGTAWITEEGIGALAYSGKLMAPHSPLPELVSRIMRNVEERLDLPNDFFDCALCNHYNSANSACKLHTDPEHSTVWHTTTVVVAVGSDRKFSFKPISGRTEWKEWDNLDMPATSTAATVSVFAGDLIVMKDSCNDDFYHAVHAGVSDEQRISLVMKRAIDRGNGRRGHGLQGQGRRNKNMKLTK